VLYDEDMGKGEDETKPTSTRRRLFTNLTDWQEQNDPEAGAEGRKLKRYKPTGETNNGLRQTADAQSLSATAERQSNQLPATDIAKNGHRWRLAVIATANDYKTNSNLPNDVDYQQAQAAASAQGYSLMTPNQYLQAQAKRFYTKQEPLDKSSWAWLTGSDASRALYSYWDAGVGQVHLNALDVSNSGAIVVARFSAWG
jgi:hypothetical protein